VFTVVELGVQQPVERRHRRAPVGIPQIVARPVVRPVHVVWIADDGRGASFEVVAVRCRRARHSFRREVVAGGRVRRTVSRVNQVRDGGYSGGDDQRRYRESEPRFLPKRL